MQKLDNTPNWPFILGTVILLALTIAAQPLWRSLEIESVPRFAESTLGREANDHRLTGTRSPHPISPSLTASVPELPPVAALSATEIPGPELPRQYADPAPRVASRAESLTLGLSSISQTNTKDGETQTGTEYSLIRSEPRETELPSLPTLPEFSPGSALTETAPKPAHQRIGCDSLRREMNQFAKTMSGENWSARVTEQLDAVEQTHGLTDESLGVILKRLVVLAEEAHQQTMPPTPPEQQTEWRRIHYSLIRRLDCWQLALAATQAGDIPRAGIRRANIQASAKTAREKIATLPQGESWNRYLQLDALLALLAPGSSRNSAELQVQAERTLAKITCPSLSPEQREVIRLPELASLATCLRAETTEPLPLDQLLAVVERYEQQPASAEASTLAFTTKSLQASESPILSHLGERLDSHYRNANFRLAIAGELLNQLLPVLGSAQEDVNDTILGARVSGTSDVSTRLRVRLVPDRRKLRLGLEAFGTVNSSTSATKGPVTFHNSGNSTFLARKQISVDASGMHSSQTEAKADTQNDVTGMDSQYDGVPLLGALVRKQARSQHAASRWEADREAEGRVSQRARDRLDSAVNSSLALAEARLQREILQPLARLNLKPTAAELQTTEERLIARYQLAADNQLAAHTPRPVAPGNSLLSIQLHESLLNNVAGQMNLAGRHIRLQDLFVELGQALGQKASEVATDLPEGVMLEFASQDPITLGLDKQEMSLTIRLAELSQGKNRWKNFVVVGRYRPDPTQRTPTLLREGPIELTGAKLGFGDQVALRGIFSKAFDKRRPIPIIDTRYLADARLANIEMTQFCLDRGWLGLAFAEHATASEPRAAAGAASLPQSRR